MKYIFTLFLSILLFSCDTSTPTEQVPDKTDITNTPTEARQPSTAQNAIETTTNTEGNQPASQYVEFNMEDLYGSYVGMFIAEEYGENRKDYTYANKINISIDEISGDAVTGHSVVAGNNRPFSGTIRDDKYDGTFTINISPISQKMTGNWQSFDSKLKVTKRVYELEKKDFKYTASHDLEGWEYHDLYSTYNEDTGESEMLTEDVTKFNPSTTELKKEDVENMRKGDLEVMRNTIYARHGYSFKNRKMRYIFNHVDWYIPMNTDIRSKLTALEKKNIDLMKRYEQHAERYYDSFGR